MYRNVLGLDVGQLQIRPKQSKHLPTVLSQTEVSYVLDRLNEPCRLMAQLIYGTGMRITECVTLRVKDLDPALGLITLRNTKGGKDRTTIFPATLEASIKQHLTQVAIRQRMI